MKMEINTTYENLCNIPIIVLRGKFVAFIGYIQKVENKQPTTASQGTR
jgi:hypothetical protein